MSSIYYVNGSFVPEHEAKLSVLDLGLMRGYGIFDYLRTYQGRPFHLHEHLMRLKYSAMQIGLSLPEPLEKIEEIIFILLKKNQFPESSIKILVTGGTSPDQLIPCEKSSLAIIVYPFKPFPDDYFQKGIKAISTPLSRMIPTCKTIQYTPAILALKEGQKQNAQEALYLNAQKEILEGTTCNFFAFKKNTLITPYSDEILVGITREVVLALAKDHFPIEIRPINYNEIPSLDEAFLCSSNKEVMPLIQIDACMIKDGKVGPKTKELLTLFRAYSRQEKWPPLSISRYQ